MLLRVQAVLEAMFSNLNADRILDLVELYDYPFVIQTEDQLLVFTSKDEAADYCRSFRAEFVEGGHLKTFIHITAQEMPRVGRFRVWTELRHQDSHGDPTGTSNAIYYFRDYGQRLYLEMMHITKLILRAPLAIEVPTAL
ncbi:MAG: hypothetical protein ABIV25_11605 [Paracoccaceae bacterium]